MLVRRGLGPAAARASRSTRSPARRSPSASSAGFGSADVLDALAEPTLERSAPGRVRSDDGPTSVASASGDWDAAAGAWTPRIALVSPRENGCVESFDSKFRNELLDGKVFRTLRTAQVLTGVRRRHHNALRPHSALGRPPPAPAVQIAGPGP